MTITDSTVPTATVAYKGVSLKNIVGYFDDGNRNTFNAKLAKKGYWVSILGMDGFVESFKGKDIAALGNKIIVASLGNDAPLPVPSRPEQGGSRSGRLTGRCAWSATSPPSASTPRRRASCASAS